MSVVSEAGLYLRWLFTHIMELMKTWDYYVHKNMYLHDNIVY